MLIKLFVSYGKYNQREIYDLKEVRIFLFAVKLIIAFRVSELRITGKKVKYQIWNNSGISVVLYCDIIGRFTGIPTLEK